MNLSKQLIRPFVMAMAIVIAAPVHAQQPPDVVNSDANDNTAMGSGALADLTTGENDTAAGAGALKVNTTGSNNTAVGAGALQSDTSGIENTAVGAGALQSSTTASQDAAFGAGALSNDTTGTDNTALGAGALLANIGGNDNTALGFSALYNTTTGMENSASGANALYSNTTGNRNNASGEGALYSNTTANDNNAMGANALHNNITGTLNNAMGNFAMEYNTTGNNNNAVGYGAMLHNTTGSDNSAQGYFSLENNTSGNLNIGVGYKAGVNLTTGSNNIDIGNAGVAAESGIIRIGTPGTQSATFVAAISGTNISGGAAVVVSSTGQLGVVSSSRRYKEDVQPMGDVSERLYQLRPVKFRYIKPDDQGQKPVQFGLIAEEVAEVLPEVVYRNAEGNVDGVRYDGLAPLLLNEVQQLHKQVAAQAVQLAKMNSLEQQVAKLQSLVATLSNQAKDERVAMR